MPEAQGYRLPSQGDRQFNWLSLFHFTEMESRSSQRFLFSVSIHSCLSVHAGLLLRSEAFFLFSFAGTLQAAAVVQEQDGDELRTLHLEEVVQEAAGEWQSLTNVF